MRNPTGSCVVVLVWLAFTTLAACSNIGADNPYDPATPAAQQATGALTGRVVLPEGFELSAFDEARIALSALDALSAAPRLAELQDESVEDGRPALRFTLPEVAAGTYFLTFTFGAFEVTRDGQGISPLPVTVGIGARLDLGDLGLRAPSADAQGTAQGQAERQGATQHGGIGVEARGTPYAAVTTSTGAYVLALPAGKYTLDFTSPGYAPAHAEAVEITEGAATEVPLQVLPGQPGAISGRVRLAAGAQGLGSVDSAAIRLLSGSMPAEGEMPVSSVAPTADGRFLLDAVAPGPYRVEVVLAGFEPEVRFIGVELEKTADVGEIELRPLPSTARIVGVASLEGAPEGGHGGILVEIAGTRYTTVTASDGKYLLATPPNVAAFTVRFLQAGYTPLAIEVGDIEPDEERTLEPVVLVGQPGSIAGTVTLPAESAVAGAVATAVVYRFAQPAGPAPEMAECVTDDDCDAEALCAAHLCLLSLQQTSPDQTGRFVLPQVGAGDYLIVARLDGFHDGVTEVRVEVGQAAVIGNIPLEALPSEGTIGGLAQIEGAVEHGGIAVTLVGTAHSTMTTNEGRFLLAVPVRALGYTLHFSKPGYSGDDVDVAALGANRHTELAEPAILTGQPGQIRFAVELPADNPNPNLIDQATVELSRFDADALTLLSADPVPHSGVVVMFPVPAGSYVIRIIHPSFDTAYQSVVLEVGEIAELGIVRLVTLGESDQGVIRGQVHLGCVGECSHGGVRVEAALSAFVTQTNEAGAFELRAPPNVYSLVFRAPGYRDGEVHELVVSARMANLLPTVVELAPLPTGVNGRVLHETAGESVEAVAGATVTVLTAGRSVVSGPSAVDGNFGLIVPNAGQYEVRFELAGHQTQTRPVQLQGGVPLPMGDLTLALRRGSVAGRVSVGAAAGHLPAGATLRLTGQPDDPNTAGVIEVAQALIADGSFVIPRLAPGRYDLDVTGAELLPAASQVVVVLPDEITRLDLRLQPRANTLTTAPLTGAAALVALTHDADLGFARVWLDEPSPPDGLVFEPLAARNPVELSVDLPTEGAHRVHVQLANGAYVDADASNDFQAALPATLFADVVRDTLPPTIQSVIIDDGDGFVRSADGDVSMFVACSDAATPTDRLTVTVRRDAQRLFSGVWQPSLRVNIGADEGPKTLEVTCTDARGLESASDSTRVLHDHTAPAITRFALLDGQNPAATSNRLVAATVVVDESGSGAENMELSADPQLDCGRVLYRSLFETDTTVSLPASEGVHRMYACVRDAAGNTSAVAISNPVTLDTIRPEAGSLLLARGRAVVRTPGIEFSIGGVAEAVTTVIEGDVEEADAYEPGTLPLALTLTEPDGLHLISVTLRDAAGNVSPTFSEVIELDRVAPRNGNVTLADGRDIVNAREVSVTVADTVADFMALTEVGPAAACPDPACGGAAFGPFAPATSFTLSPDRGEKRVCWKFCDLAGNGSVAGAANVTLGTYLPRPRPVITESTPRRIVPRDCETAPAGRVPLTLTGRGFPADMIVQIGAFSLPCTTIGAADCQADPNGGCAVPDGVCERTCAETCTVDLPDYILKISASHVVRASTPDPVFGGEGTSANFEFLDIVAPVPQIWFMSELGVTQDAVGDQFPGRVLELEVTGCGFLENTQFQLGPTVGSVSSVVADADDPVMQVAHVTVSTANIPADTDDTVFFTTNLPPGGGRADVGFGINPTFVAERAVYLGRTATRLGTRPVRGLVLTDQAVRACCARTWPGSDAISVFDGTGANAAGLRARFRKDDSGGILPFGALRPAAFRMEERGPPSRNRSRPAATLGGDGTFLAPVPLGRLTIPAGGQLLAMNDRNEDGIDDILVLRPSGGPTFVAFVEVDGTLGIGAELPTAGALRHDFSDLDGDGLDDLTWWGDDAMYSRRGDHGVLLGRSVRFPAPDPFDAAAIADIDGDGQPDQLFTSNLDLVVQRGQLDGRTSTHVVVVDQLSGGRGRYLAAGDMDGDARTDVVVSTTNDLIEVHLQQPDGGLELSQSLAANDCGELELTDFNGDGLTDLAAECYPQNGVKVWLNTGRGSLGAPAVYQTATPASALEVADLNADGRPDIVASTEAGHFSLLTQRPDATFAVQNFATRAAADHASHTIPADVDRDGTMDLVHLDSLGLEIFRGNPGHLASRTGTYLHSTGRTSVTESVGDLDGDGLPDLVLLGGAPGDETVDLRLGRPDGLFGDVAATLDIPNVDAQVADVLLADITNDGHVEVIETVADGAIHVWLNDGEGGLFFPVRLPRAGGQPYKLKVGRDPATGVASLYATLIGSPLVLRWVFSGGGYQPMPDIDTGCALAPNSNILVERLELADLDEDGRLDMVSKCTSGQISIRLQRAGNAAWVAPGVPFAPPAGTLAFAHATGDLDGDGHQDLALVVSDQLGLVVYYGRGNATFEAAVRVPGTASGGMGLTIVDLNGDGAGDLLARSTNELNYLVGRGGRTFEAFESLGMLGVALRAPIIADLGGDGVPDLVVGDAGNETIVVVRDGARPWTQELVDLARPAVSVAAGARADLTLHQERQSVDRVSVRVRLEGTELDDVTLTLLTPRGETIVLESGAGDERAGDTVWLASYPTLPAAGDLTRAHGWQPRGNWTLRVDNAGGSAARVVDFAVLTHGYFQR